jgi:uncharacterized membrane protein
MADFLGISCLCATMKFMSTFKPTSLLDKVFEGGIILKGLSGLLELLGGLLAFFMTPERLNHFVNFITQEELIAPHQRLTSWLSLHSDHFTSGSRWFIMAYLFIHAAVKLTAVIGILKNQLWAYPFSLIALGLMTLYQVWDIVFVQARLGMVVLTVFDCFILWLIWREYQRKK